MIKVFTAQNHAEAHLVKGLLEAEGIPAEVRGEALSALDGGLAVLGFRPTVWIPKSHNLARATELVESFSRRQPSTLHSGSLALPPVRRAPRTPVHRVLVLRHLPTRFPGGMRPRYPKASRRAARAVQ